MATNDVDVVHRFTNALRSNDISGCLQLLHPENVIAEADGLPYGGSYHGHEGFIRLIKDVNRLFELSIDELRVRDAGESIMVELTVTLTSRATGRTLTLPVIDLYRVRDGKVANVDVYYKDSRAIYELAAER